MVENNYISEAESERIENFNELLIEYIELMENDS